MHTWLLKTEPGDYSFDDLVRDKRTTWTGVKNNLALIYVREIRKGDCLLIYHTGKEKQMVGVARAASDPYPDPQEGDPKLVVFDLVPQRKLKQPVPLKDIKADKRFKDFKLVTISRLSVMPVAAQLEQAILEMAGE